MAENRELETKLLLDEAGFEALKSIGRLEQRRTQLNIYFDSGWRLADSAITCRIRIEPNIGATATLKVPVADVSGRREMRELETRLGRLDRGLYRHRFLNVATDLPPGWKEEVTKLGVKSLERVGWMRNTRYVLVFDDKTLEVDRFSLPDGSVVFEAEIESTDLTTHEALTRLVLKLVPTAEVSGISKFQRFRAAVVAPKAQAGPRIPRLLPIVWGRIRGLRRP